MNIMKTQFFHKCQIYIIEKFYEFFTLKPYDLITSLTYVLMDNWCPCLQYILASLVIFTFVYFVLTKLQSFMENNISSQKIRNTFAVFQDQTFLYSFQFNYCSFNFATPTVIDLNLFDSIFLFVSGLLDNSLFLCYTIAFPIVIALPIVTTLIVITLKGNSEK